MHCTLAFSRCEACADSESCEHCNAPLLLRRLYDANGDPTTVGGRTHECATTCDAVSGEFAFDEDEDMSMDACLRCTDIDPNCVLCSASEVASSRGSCDACAEGFHREQVSGVPGVYDACVNCTDACANDYGPYFFYDSTLAAVDQVCASGTDTPPLSCANCSSIDENCLACGPYGVEGCVQCPEGYYLEETLYTGFAAQANLLCEDDPQLCPVESLADCIAGAEYLEVSYSSTSTTSSAANIYGCYVQGGSTLVFNSLTTSVADTKGTQALICGLCAGRTKVYDNCVLCEQSCDTGFYFAGGTCNGTSTNGNMCVQCNATIDNCLECNGAGSCTVCT